MIYISHTRTDKSQPARSALVSFFVLAAILADGALPRAATAGCATRVRSSDVAVLELLQEGVERSATFRALVGSINDSNGVVYVEFGYCAFGHLNGCLLPFMASTQSDRYLRIIVTPDKNRRSHDQLLALVGHELQHAREVLEHREVVDIATMVAMYRKIGTPIAGGPRGFETAAASAAGNTILAELSGSLGQASAAFHQ